MLWRSLRVNRLHCVAIVITLAACRPTAQSCDAPRASLNWNIAIGKFVREFLDVRIDFRVIHEPS